MQYYPVCLDVRGRKCLVVGGGSVGTRKVEMLVRCGAAVDVISDSFSDKLITMSDTVSVRLLNKEYEESDLDGVFLVIGSTDNHQLNLMIGEHAGQRNILCNIADNPEGCNFILPSVVNRGDLSIAVSTSGKSPAFAKRLRKELSEQFGDEYAVFLHLMGAVRKTLLLQNHDPEGHKQLFVKLIEGGLLDLIKTNNTTGIDSLLLNVLGEGFSFENLVNDKV